MSQVIWNALPEVDFEEAASVFTTLVTAEQAGLTAQIEHGDYLRNEKVTAAETVLTHMLTIVLS